MRTLVEEQETNITFDRQSQKCYVYTSDYTVMTRLDKLAANSKDWEVVEQLTNESDIVGKKYVTNKRLISFRGKLPDGPHKKMSDADKIRMGQILKEGRERKKAERNEQ